MNLFQQEEEFDLTAVKILLPKVIIIDDNGDIMAGCQG
jgi:hypothetical protein